MNLLPRARVPLWSAAISALLAAYPAFAVQPPSVTESAAEPIRYVGKPQPDPAFFDGRLPHAVGVHAYQVLRANRSQAPEGGLFGWTYNHAPMLAYWQGRFWLQYLSNPKEEHMPPGRTLVASSTDGRHWAAPQVVFPEIMLPAITPPARYFEGRYQVPPIAAGTGAIMHQRMGWYVAPNGRLLTLAFYSYCPSVRWGPNRGQGIGRVVREVFADGTFGPIHFIRYNREAGWDEKNTPWFPSYQKSHDNGFVAACDALLANKLMVQQWWEEDRQQDGFFALNPPPGVEPKAFTWYVRPDGVTVGLWKTHTALSPDGGKTWTPIVRMPTLWDVNGKIWAQRTSDGRYALSHTQSATHRNRFPLVVMTGDDGRDFDDMLVVHGETSPMRYQGINKNIGPNYIRGIVTGNGMPPDGRFWITYSMNKEDIWVTNVRVPIGGTVGEPVRDDFDSAETGGDLALWNIHSPLWAPVQVAADPLDPRNRVLELRDRDPWEYAKAFRMFPAASRAAVEFRVMLAQAGPGLLEVEVQGARGERGLRLRIDPEWLSFDLLKAEVDSVRWSAGHWHAIRLEIDAGAGTYDCWLDGRKVATGVELQENVHQLQRLEFRTGAWRQDVPSSIVRGEPGSPGSYREDLAGADTPVAESAYMIDDVRTSPLP
jgi:hypothetical protein